MKLRHIIESGITIADLGISSSDVAMSPISLTSKNIVSLAGCPERIGYSFNADHNRLKNLIGGPKIVDGYYSVDSNMLESLDGLATSIDGSLYIKDNNFTHGLMRPILGCVGITDIDCDFNPPGVAEAIEIIMKHYKAFDNVDLLACQKELVKAGLRRFV